MSYVDTFITVSEDSPAKCGVVPPDKKDTKSKTGIEYELLSGNPYSFTQEDLIYEVYVEK